MATQEDNQLPEDVFGCDSVSGGWDAILKTTGIDIREFSQVMDGSGNAVVLNGGHEWTIKPWTDGGGFAVASRPQTEAEIERDRQRMLRNTYVGHFTKDRLLLCIDIAGQLRELAEQMRPDRPPARAARRSMQCKLKRLAQIQESLLCLRGADSTKHEQELKQLRSA